MYLCACVCVCLCLCDNENVCASPWLQNVLIIDSWPHYMKGGNEFRAVGIKEGTERVADVTRIIT